MHDTFIIGVAGGSGSGKTTVLNNLTRAASDKAIAISHDHYYRDQSHLDMSQRTQTNYDHPKSLETELLIEHLQQLKNGQTISHPTYDFLRHTRAKQTVKIEPKKIIIVEGILLFESKDLRQLFDMKVFVDTDDDIRFIRRLQRDVSERGRTPESIIEQYLKTVRPMYIEFVEPSKRHADIIIPEGGENTVALDLLLARIEQIVK